MGDCKGTAFAEPNIVDTLNGKLSNHTMSLSSSVGCSNLGGIPSRIESETIAMDRIEEGNKIPEQHRMIRLV